MSAHLNEQQSIVKVVIRIMESSIFYHSGYKLDIYYFKATMSKLI